VLPCMCLLSISHIFTLASEENLSMEGKIIVVLVSLVLFHITSHLTQFHNGRSQVTMTKMNHTHRLQRRILIRFTADNNTDKSKSRVTTTQVNQTYFTVSTYKERTSVVVFVLF